MLFLYADPFSGLELLCGYMCVGGLWNGQGILLSDGDFVCVGLMSSLYEMGEMFLVGLLLRICLVSCTLFWGETFLFSDVVLELIVCTCGGVWTVSC